MWYVCMISSPSNPSRIQYGMQYRLKSGRWGLGFTQQLINLPPPPPTRIIHCCVALLLSRAEWSSLILIVLSGLMLPF
ncbi:uncharacterized protein BO66DRAFT_196180 [Aspergillus aculeatinus CBS 121060]|uniref:Uncharacterized protein n=1 Tax=Aspergillus aculeatinus CBS 121060 TaxID=1448322 RepID=A0ACD1GWN1_9EURO|nr:hypothetical protein BO66DRAFT_196180 [Aspergillus aculeatinus CBS 121060]RAH65739.1 hypothetical protein BO66DRAFT_196180 [Aspergillus aculeatinus CBS 121060]